MTRYWSEVGCGRRRPFILRLLSDRCSYPNFRFLGTDAIYSPSPSLVYTAVLSEAPLDNVNELPWADIAEIRLWGALAFSIPEGRGFYGFYPLAGAEYVPFTIWADELAPARVERIARRAQLHHAPQSHDLHWHEPDAVEVAALYEALKSADNVLLRGVNCYLKAQMLMTHPRFVEEMGINLYIALEAGLTVLRRQLSDRARRGVSFEEVFQHVRETFPYGDSLVDVWTDARDDRNIVVHPDCYLGPEVMHPQYADDLLELFGPMLTLYRYVMLGVIGPRTF